MGIFVGAGTSSFLKDGEGVGVTRISTSTRDGLSGANRVEGQIIYNTDKDALQIWNGSNWATVGDNYSATGGTKSTSGNYTYHLFESPGNFVATGGGRNLEVFVASHFFDAEAVKIPPDRIVEYRRSEIVKCPLDGTARRPTFSRNAQINLLSNAARAS